MSKSRRQQDVAAHSARAASPSSPEKNPPEPPQPAPRMWQKMFLLLASFCLAAWLVALLFLAWK
jgi:hypothetical protein